MTAQQEREAFEAWATAILGDNPTWRESGDCELAWQSWQARASLSLPSSGDGRDAEPSLTNDQMHEIAMAHASRNWVNDYPQSIESVCKMAVAMSQGSQP